MRRNNQHRFLSVLVYGFQFGRLEAQERSALLPNAESQNEGQDERFLGTSTALLLRRVVHKIRSSAIARDSSRGVSFVLPLETDEASSRDETRKPASHAHRPK